MPASEERGIIVSLHRLILHYWTLQNKGASVRWIRPDIATMGKRPPQLKHTSPAAYLRLHPKRINNFSVVKKKKKEGWRRQKNASHPEGKTKQASRHCGALKKIPNKASHPLFLFQWSSNSICLESRGLWMKIFSLSQIKTLNINHRLQDSTSSNWSHTLRLQVFKSLENGTTRASKVSKRMTFIRGKSIIAIVIINSNDLDYAEATRWTQWKMVMPDIYSY